MRPGLRLPRQCQVVDMRRLLICVLASFITPAASLRTPPTTAVDGLTVRYFAFGSNLAASVREGRRGLTPVSSSPGLVRSARLAFNLPGFSPREPAFASLATTDDRDDECHGATFELTMSDWLRLLASEGVPAAYRVERVDVEEYSSGATRPAYTLAAAFPSPVDLPPSERYLTLICEGAREMGLTSEWQERLASIETAQGTFGKRKRAPRSRGSGGQQPGGGGVWR